MRNWYRSLALLLGVLLFFLGCGVRTSPEEASANTDLDKRRAFLDYEALFLEGQDIVAKCMQAEGFEYFIVDETPTALLPEYTEDLRNGIEESEFAAKWGFGISTTQLYGTLSEDEIMELQAQQLSRESKSDRYYNSLSDADQLAYDTALYGEEDEEGEGGCDAEGNASLRALIEASDNSFESIDTAKDQFAVDRRVVQHYEDWSGCMVTEGYRYETPMLAALDIEDRYWHADWTNDELMAKIQLDEIELAKASVKCGSPASNLLEPDLGPVWDELSET